MNVNGFAQRETSIKRHTCMAIPERPEVQRVKCQHPTIGALPETLVRFFPAICNIGTSPFGPKMLRSASPNRKFSLEENIPVCLPRWEARESKRNSRTVSQLRQFAGRW